MYINFWYPAAWSEEVTNEKPIRVTMLGQRFTLFRDTEGKAHCLHDVCIHRGGSLGGGKVKGDHVACPYHGWEFDGTGACKTIPSLGFEAKVPSRAKVDSYPVQEKYGMVFAFLGDLPEEERPSIREMPEWAHADWKMAKPEVIEVNYTFERSVENGLDVAHNEYVHPSHGFSGRKPDYSVRPITATDQEEGSGFVYTFVAPPAFGNVRSYEGDLEVGSWHQGPNQLITYIHITEEAWAHQYFFETPIDHLRTRIFFLSFRNFMTEDEHDGFVTERNLAIAGEDVVVLDEVRPRLTPPGTAREMMVPADQPILKYREWLERWEKRGWKIDVPKVLATFEDVAYAIPSPNRRTQKGWILDAIPTIPASEAAKAAAE